MAQNSKFTDPRETRATAMNRADFTANFTMRLSSIYLEPVRGLLIKKLRLLSGNCSMIWG